jgi:amidase
MKKHSCITARALISGMLLAAFMMGCSTEDHHARQARQHAFIEYHPLLDDSGRLRLAVKDNIDLKGEVTSAGSEYLYRTSQPAAHDALVWRSHGSAMCRSLEKPISPSLR